MDRKIVLVGDPIHPSGHTLPTGFTESTVNGVPFAIIGGPALCKTCGSTGTIAKTGGPIRLFMTEGSATYEVAMENDIMLCKCKVPPTLIARAVTLSQPTVRADDGAEGLSSAWSRTDDRSAPAPVSAPLSETGWNSGANWGVPNNRRYDEQLQFRNTKGTALAHVHYTLTLGDGRKVLGTTTAQGKTQRIVTEIPLAIERVELRAPKATSCCTLHDENTEDSPDTLQVPIEDVFTNAKNVGSSIVQVRTPPEQSRPMTSGEIAMSRLLFGDSIDYSKVKIHNGSFFWFDLQAKGTAVTPNGNIYFNTEDFLEDFSKLPREDFNLQLWFMHEMVHVWQYQLGFPVMLRGAVRIGLSYEYELDINKTLNDYNMEAQGNLLSDYWALAFVKNPPLIWERKKYLNNPNILSSYKKVLTYFLANPSDAKNLPGG